MGLSLLESFRKLIRQDTVTIGQTVGNIHGAVRVDLADISEVVSQTWLALRINGSQVLPLTDYFDAFAEQTSTLSLETAIEGRITVTTRPNTVLMLRTVVEAERSLSFNLDITIPGTGATAAIYVDGTLIRTVSGSVAVPLNISAGRHTLYVQAVAPTITVAVPTKVRLVGETEIPRAPQWVSIQTGYLDEGAGTARTTLRWHSDPEVGSYRVYRREPILLADLTKVGDGLVTTMSPLGPDSTFTVTMGGDQGPKLEVGAFLIANGQTLGVVTSVTVTQITEDDETTTTVDESAYQTTLACRLAIDLETLPNVVGQFLSVGSFNEIARVSRVVNASVVEYVDSAVNRDHGYEYVLRAVGLVDETVLSPTSQVQYIVAGDIFAPGPITILEDYPTVTNRLVTVKFDTPTDLDYAGVNVYYRQQVMNSVLDPEAPPEEEVFIDVPYELASVGSNKRTLTAVLNEFPDDEDSTLEGFQLQLTLENFPTYTFTIAENTTNSVTIAEDLPDDIIAAIADALGDNIEVGMYIYKDTEVKSDFGLPNRQDELQFFGENYGLYYFATFDRSRNQQSFDDAAVWTYTPADDQFTGGPIVAFRQLTKTEQAFFVEAPEDYSDPKVYALVELYAYNANSPKTPPQARFEGVEIHYQRKGDETPTVLFPVPQQYEPYFPYEITAENEVLVDDRVGVVITDFVRTNNVTTVTTETPHGFVVEQLVEVAGATTASLNGTFEVTAVTASTFSYANTGPNLLPGDREGVARARSRFVALNRTEDDTWIRVWAVDAIGRESDVLSFVVDLDTTPEISSLETFLDNNNNTASFIAVGDDDTFGVQWHVDPAGPQEPSKDSPFHVDLRRNKVIRGVVDLPLGASKRLILLPCGSFDYSLVPLATSARSNDITTFVTTEPHGLVVGQWFDVLGSTLPELNTRYRVKTVTNPTTVTVDDPGGGLAAQNRSGSIVIGIAGAPFGEPVNRDLVRTPRSFVTFDTKDTDGNRVPDTVTARFAMAPAPAPQNLGTTLQPATTSTGVVSANAVSDAGRTWSVTAGVGQWTTGDLNYYYAWIAPENEKPLIRTIVGSSASTLLLGGDPLPTTHQGTHEYRILDGAVMFQRLSSADTPQGLNGFAPTAGEETFTGENKTFYMAFYATKTGCTPENVRVMQVDPDSTASLKSLQPSYESETTQLRYTANGFDDDAKTWRCYVKKTGWPIKNTVNKDPTLEQLEPSDIDEQYIRYSGSINQPTFSINAGEGTWYAVAVPVNSLNSEGTVTKAPPFLIGEDNPTVHAIREVTATPQIDSGIILVSWKHTPNAPGSVSITVTEQSLTPPKTTSLTTNHGVQADQGQAIDGAGTYSHNTGRKFKASGKPLVYEYAVTYQSKTETVRITAYVEDTKDDGGDDDITLTATASAGAEGTCVSNTSDPTTTRVACGIPFSNDITVTTNASAALHDINISISREQDPVNWYLIAVMPPAPAGVPLTFEDQYKCYYRNRGGGIKYFTYKVDVVAKATGAILQSVTCDRIATRILTCDFYNEE